MRYFQRLGNLELKIRGGVRNDRREQSKISFTHPALRSTGRTVLSTKSISFFPPCVEKRRVLFYLSLRFDL